MLSLACISRMFRLVKAMRTQKLLQRVLIVAALVAVGEAERAVQPGHAGLPVEPVKHLLAALDLRDAFAQRQGRKDRVIQAVIAQYDPAADGILRLCTERIHLTACHEEIAGMPFSVR